MEPSLPKNCWGRDTNAGASPGKVFDHVHDGEECRIDAAFSTAFMRLSLHDIPPQLCGSMGTAAEIRKWLKETAAERHLSFAAWAKLANAAPSTIQRAAKDDYNFVTSSRSLAKLAAAIGVATPTVTQQPAQSVRPAFLPIRYEVGAGVWRSVDDPQDFYGSGPVLPDPAFNGFHQWLERVVTDSMDRDYPIGTLLHVVDAIDIGYAPRTGDHVVIERRRDGGGVVERTVKEVIITPSKIEFWPRSNNPKWDGPISLADGQDAEGCTVEIRGLVLGSYKSRR